MRVGLVQHEWVDDPDGPRRDAPGRHPHGGRGRRRDRLPARADAVPLPGRHAARGHSRGDRRGPATPARRSRFAAEPRTRLRRPRARLALRARRRGRRPGLQHRRSSSPRTASSSARTRKTHIPVTAGYYEDKYFRPGPAARTRIPVLALGDSALRLGLPTCWDEWFPEVARAYSLGGAEVLVYPTAIGSEPDHPAFDTQPLWQQVIVGNGIANGLFMVVPEPLRHRGRHHLLRLARSSPTPTAASSSRRRATSPPCSSPTSTSRSASDWLDAVPVPRDPPPRLVCRLDRPRPRRAPSRGRRQ